MFSQLLKRAPIGSSFAIKRLPTALHQARCLATVETNTPRQMPVGRKRTTPVSHDRATLTIRVLRGPTDRVVLRMLINTHRMALSSAALPSAPSQTSPAKQSLPLLLLDTPNP